MVARVTPAREMAGMVAVARVADRELAAREVAMVLWTALAMVAVQVATAAAKGRQPRCHLKSMRHLKSMQANTSSCLRWWDRQRPRC